MIVNNSQPSALKNLVVSIVLQFKSSKYLPILHYIHI